MLISIQVLSYDIELELFSMILMKKKLSIESCFFKSKSEYFTKIDTLHFPGELATLK